jgi:TonB family protein
MPDWKACEGQLDGKYPLERCVYSDNESALYLTASGGAAVRIRRADPAQAAEIVGHWNRVKRFPHPNLISVDAAGTSELNGESVAYLVMEHAEENLGDVVCARTLTPEECRAMLLPVATALDYLHRRGLAHGAVKPSHIFAIGDTVKLSSESVAEGDTADDIRGLGLTVVEALAPRNGTASDAADRTAELPPPYDSIAIGCLNPDPARRWTADRVIAPLRPAERASTPADPQPARRPGVRRLAIPAGLAAVTIGILVGVVFRQSDAPPPSSVVREPAAPPPRFDPEPAPVTPPPAAKTAEAPPRPAPPAAQPSREAPSTGADRLVMENGVANRVVPDVPQRARNTITGKPFVTVRVTVNPAGDVSDAAVEHTFSSYFSKLALEAARKWKFAPQDGAAARRWNLRFEFTRANTRATAQPAP